MDKEGVLKLPYPRIVEIWKANMNTGIWVANKRARELMDAGVVPPETGSVERNPHAWYNLSGQFCVESYGLITPGMPQTAADIAKLARSRNSWFAMDGAQAPVCVPFDIVETGVDFYTSSTHKWLMGPKRTGFLYVRQGMLDTLRPVTVGAVSSSSTETVLTTLSLPARSRACLAASRTSFSFFADIPS